MRDASFTAIETARLRLRRFAPADIAAFHAYRADEDVARFQSWQHYTVEKAERFVEEMASHDPGVPGEPFQFAVALRDDDRRVGACMLALDADAAPRAEIGYTVAPGNRGSGYSIEAGHAVLDYAFDHKGSPPSGP